MTEGQKERVNKMEDMKAEEKKERGTSLFHCRMAQQKDPEEDMVCVKLIKEKREEVKVYSSILITNHTAGVLGLPVVPQQDF